MTDVASFMHKYYDWAAFETFIKELYEADGDVVVERDVTEVDRYGAKRQTDVKITRRTRFHTFVTLVECKRWKEPVGRDRIDVLAASIEALGANKGAIFTTTGFEEGAVAYAKGKGIDLFVVRDLTPQEWGHPGRHVFFYLHTWAAEFQNVLLPNTQAISLVDENPGSIHINLLLDSGMAKDPDMDLFSVKTGSRGPNLIGLLGDVHGLILRNLGQTVDLIDGGKPHVLEVLAACEVVLTGTEYRQLRLPTVAAKLDRIQFGFVAHVTQSQFSFDRGADLDFAVVIEDFISEQRLVAHRWANDPGIRFHVPNPAENIGQDPFQNGMLFKTFLAPWVRLGDVEPDIHSVGQQLIRVFVDVVDGKPKLALRSEPLPKPAP
ncbi:MAG TPA: restriction endonuclease [Symbiobacteriaceae bacterium]|nr:restriction endonuclease [Symbiobacteriaceae bacterium]